MNPQRAASAVGRRPQRRWGLALALALALALPGSALAQKKKRREPARRPAPSAPADTGDQAAGAEQPAASGKAKGKGKVQVFDFSGLELQGSMRTPQLLYFLGRASEELRRASLERRSFVPEMVRSLEEAPL